MRVLLTTPRLVALAAPIMLTGALLLSFVGSAFALAASAAPLAQVSTPPTRLQGPTDPAEVQAFLDAFFATEMDERHIAGAAVSIVRDGKLFLAGGYGYADLENGIRVDPERTMFRIGSVTKLFTWTAVMQLVEQEKLDLDTDINEYLDFRIPDTYSQPITLRHLLSHTSGFEDYLLGAIVPGPEELVSAREWLTSHVAARVLPPGEAAGYSNYNAVLAGYIVGWKSGQSYEQFIQDHVLDPLGMTHSTARALVPSDLRPHQSNGYRYAAGSFQAFPAYVGQPAGLPSGGVQASVTDVARFMIAHLQGGRYSDSNGADARILEESTARQMHSALYTPDPRLRGTGYGFFDVSDNDQRTFGHQGYSPPMHSLLLLLPDQNTGIFVTFNSAGAGGLTTQHTGFQRAFFDHYYPRSTVEPVAPPSDFAERAGRFVGSYRWASTPRSNLSKVGALFGYTVVISAPGDGTLLVSTEGATYRFVEVAPLYFRQVDGPFGMIFRQDDRGRIADVATDLMPQYTSVKLDWYETPNFHVLLLQGFVGMFVLLAPVAVMRLVRNRRRGRKPNPATRGARVGDWIVLGICLLNLLFMAGTFQWVMRPSELHSPLLIYELVLGLGVVSAVLTVGALAYMATTWWKGYWGLAARAYYTLATVAAVGFVVFLNYWNLLGWRY